MRILWLSNAPWANTGYGVQTKLFASRLQKAGNDVSILAFYGLQGAIMKYDDIPILPPAVDVYGNDIMRAHMKALDADALLTLIDIFVLDPAKTAHIPWVAWMPVDHSPVSPPVVKSLREGRGIPLAISQFGASALKDQGFDAIYVPHGVDPEYLVEQDRTIARKAFGGWDGRFVVGMVAANKGAFPSRKSFAEAILAYSIFRGKHPEALLYLHTDKFTAAGLDLEKLLHTCGVPQEAVQFVDHYRYNTGLPPSYLRDAYSAMDVMLNPAMGEGFGVPILEAQACGTPVIVSNFTAMPELCWFGQMVEGQPFYTAQESFQMIPSIDDIVDKLEWAYNLSDEERKAGSILARSKAAEYHPDLITERYWTPALEEVTRRIEARDDLKGWKE